jgi:hypothetical protein
VIVHGDGTVTDERTGLVWRQFGEARGTWEAVMALAKAAAPWRVPTVAELVSLVDYGRREPAIDPTFACAQERYWTAEKCQCSPRYAWNVDFLDGSVDADPMTQVLRVRVVRSP